MSIEAKLEATLNRLTKWRTVFASWQLGTRSKEDPVCQAVKDHRELTIVLRVETSALLQLMLDKNVFTLEEFQTVLTEQAEHLNLVYQKRFPGFKAVDDGMSINIALAKDTTQGWLP